MLLIDQLAELTGHRNRQHADMLLLDTLQEVLAPADVALHRSVGESPDLRWLSCSRLSDGTCERSDSDAGTPVDVDKLPALQTQPAWAECLRQLSPMEHADEPGTLLLPLVVGTQGTGVVELRRPQPLSDFMRRTAEAIVRFYGNFLALLDYGERDALTGLLNRKTFNDSFMRAVLQPAADEPTPPVQYYLAVLAVDQLKQVKDNLGHLIGDEVVMLTARILRAVLRVDDGLFRFGGDEFFVLLEAASEDEVHAILEQVRAPVAQYHYPQVGNVTLRAGFTAVQRSDLPPSAIGRADRALQQAMARGGNCVVGPSKMDAAGLSEAASGGGDVDLF
jgi:diguanylate cyclase (GGDEF)-like protein